MDTIDNGDEAVNGQHLANTDHDHTGHDDHAGHEHHGDHVAATTPDVDGADHVSADHGTAEHDGAGTDSLADLDSPGHLFDQTNGLADGLSGDSDGTAESDVTSDAERGDTDVTPGADGADFNPNDRI
ncbi:hypothetical protein [Curtobacterium sp. Leaf261]|uniref:hypothetical protein n=1 Tax=Curtobacterium sp. Leaf261 TaxID=1736311 RepID=UPI0006FB827D|nr:hypothetical protein [Curtobacterium sp. Leaf261]KQO63763.1 hypothetical protein ASF23_05995 [Curtobacterium sp. Leaf261]